MSALAEWIIRHGWVFMLVPAVAYALWAFALHGTGKPWTAAAWVCYVGANIFFLTAFLRGE